MLTSQYANNVTFFYPLGNTPAVSLVQNLPAETQADVLLLGSGDVRHILFTVHSDHRPLDITCCDVEKAVIARNVLLLSLLVDGVDKSRNVLCWNLYYHFRIDKPSLQLLQTQARKLCSLSTSLQAWHASKYGKLIRMCDLGSLIRIREMWDFYGIRRENEKLSSHFEKQYEAYIQKSHRYRAHLGININLTGLRSSSPVYLSSLGDLGTLHGHYWKHGSTDLDQHALSLAAHANPMFMSPENNVVLHYGTDPLLGFHLATAYVPLAPDSPLFRSPVALKSTENVVEAARTEFYAWSLSFKKFLHLVKLRVCVGDALAFSHSLQLVGNPQSSASIHWYRDRFHFDTLILDGEVHAPDRTGPLTFAVIDTSNLIDHVGALNLLVATAPLLKNDISAILYTEKLTRSDSSYSMLFDDLLCGPLTTISMLLGVVPMDLVTNTSCLSSADEAILSGMTRSSKTASSHHGQLFTRIAWKRPLRRNDGLNSDPPPGRISLDPGDLATVLYHVYLRMFESEDMKEMMSNKTSLKLQKFSLPTYHRASFVAFIYCLKFNVDFDRQETIGSVLDLIETNISHLMTRNYIQELYTWLHLLNIYSVDTLRTPLNCSVGNSIMGDLRDWKYMPSVVAVTLEVPREKLKVFADGDISKTGTPPVHCVIQGSSNGRPWQNIFGAIQIGFGKIEGHGIRFSDSFRVNIIEDESSWSGTAPLFVSFYAPAWMLLLQPTAASVGFGVMSTPQSTPAFIGSLGLNLTVYQTTLSDSNRVYISKSLPNQAAVISGLDRTSQTTASSGINDEKLVAKKSIKIIVEPGTAKIASLAGRIDLLSDDGKAALAAGGLVTSAAETPFNFIINLQPEHNFTVSFPTAALESNLKTRIARKSSYVELICQVADGADWHMFHSFMYPVFIDSGVVTAWNMSYLNFATMPILDTKQSTRLSWLTTHTSLMFSARERLLRGNPSLQASAGERTRLDFKDSLFTLFMTYSGLQGQRSHIFGINCPANGGVQILIFVSSLRLDLSSRTVVLDMAVLPLYNALMPRISSFLQSLTNAGGIRLINATEAEMRVWKEALPSFVERCRTWSHKPTCEYLAKRKVPLSVVVGERLLCSCGEGVLPTKFAANVPSWNTVARYTVRAAISPCFPAATTDTVGEDFRSLVDEAQDKNLNVCRVCGKDTKADGSNLLNCARCHQVKYCSRECQRTDWKTHKGICKA